MELIEYLNDAALSANYLCLRAFVRSLSPLSWAVEDLMNRAELLTANEISLQV